VLAAHAAPRVDLVGQIWIERAPLPHGISVAPRREEIPEHAVG
jgi:hypothetical protein